MDVLSNHLEELKRINNNLLFSLDNKVNERDRIACIDKIDKQCKLIIPHNQEEKEQFVILIKKYIIIQEKYKKDKVDLITTQLKIRNPNLTESECNDIILQGNYKNALCVYDVHSMHDYVSLRHKEILKLEQSIQKLKELFIASYSLVEIQGEKVDIIAEHINNAKEDVKFAKIDLTETIKIKKKWYYL